ncbi:MAG: exopolysaccharide biosynthesis protein [bacterium]|nr:exopolysaccharide biosynthesis protein [bacterium]
MAVEFRDTEASLSTTLDNIAQSIRGEKVTLRELLTLIGEQGLLLFCIFLTIPFLIPVSIPGVSTVFGLVIILIGVGVTLNRLPWLPKRLMEREFATQDLLPALQRGAQFVGRIDRFIRPRLPALSSGGINRVNGFAIIFTGLLLMVPLGLVPFSNTLPALGILLFAAGMLQRDGLFILGGYFFMIATLVYFGVLALGAIAAGQGISSLMGVIPFIAAL